MATWSKVIQGQQLLLGADCKVGVKPTKLVRGEVKCKEGTEEKLVEDKVKGFFF